MKANMLKRICTTAAAVSVGTGPALAVANPCELTVERPLIAYQRSVNDGGASEIYSMASDGTGQTRLTNSPGYDGMPSWSPDQSRIAFASNRDSTQTLNFELYVMDANGANQIRLTNSAGIDWMPDWSPTSDKIAFRSTRDGNSEIYVVNADGSGLQRLTFHSGSDTMPAWSPDGQRIVFASSRSGGPGLNLHIMNADGSNVRRLTDFNGFDENPSWSPDGKTIAFSRALSLDNVEVHIVSTSFSNGVPLYLNRLTFRDGYDGDPTWSPDGRIAYASAPPDGASGSDIRVINSDGSGGTALTTHPDWEGTPDWGWVPPPVEGAIGDRVWHDLDGDGVQDAGEPGVAGVRVELLGNEVPLGEQTTDANGAYCFVARVNSSTSYRLLFDQPMGSFTVQNVFGKNTVNDSDADRFGSTPFFKLTGDNLTLDAGLIGGGF